MVAAEGEVIAALIRDLPGDVAGLRQIGEEFYVLPSSIHEVILLPVSYSGNPAELEALVKEVNETCVTPEDYLSGHVYRYFSDTGELKI